MRGALLVMFAACAAACGAVSPPFLMCVPEMGDPSTQREPWMVVPNANNILTCFVPRETEEYTLVCWSRCFLPEGDGMRFPAVSLSVEAARSTSEGGAGLPAVRDFAPVTLSPGGTWSMDGLPTAYELPGTLRDSDWRWGCFCVNVLTATPLTITVAGTERQVPAADGKQIFNILGSAADRSVTIAAADPAAAVDFGIAVNPLRQFFGGATQPEEGGPPGWESDINMSNECTYTALCCRIVGATNCTWDAAWRTPSGKSGRFGGTGGLWKARARFARDARISLNWFSSSPVYSSNEVYGVKWVPRWLPDEEIDRIYDADLEEIRRRRYLGQ